MKCKVCGNEVPEFSTFCPMCGSEVNASDNKNTDQSQDNNLEDKTVLLENDYMDKEQSQSQNATQQPQFEQANQNMTQQTQYGQANQNMAQQSQYSQNNQNVYQQSQYGQNMYQQPQYGQANQNMAQQSQYSQNNQNMTQQTQYGQTNQNTYQQSLYGQNSASQGYGYEAKDNYNMPQSGSIIGPSGQVLGMNWFKFIIYFQLFAAAFLNVILGLMVMTGAHYNSQGSTYGYAYRSQSIADLVYTTFPGLKTVDILYGLVCLGIAAFAIIVRMNLAKYKKNGPKLYFIYLGTALCVGLLYVVLVSSVTGVSLWSAMGTRDYSQIIADIVLIVVNIIYFGNRKHLFVYD